MVMFRRSLMVLLCGVGLAGQAGAADRALIVANENYRNGADISAADDVGDAAPALDAAGFVVTLGRDADAEAILKNFSTFLSDEGGGRIAIVLAGHFAHTAGETWLLGVEADAPNLVSVSSVGLPLSAVLAAAAEAPGGAAVLLGTETRRFALGTGLTAGIGTLDIPQGVTVIQGDAGEIAAFADTRLPTRGLGLRAMLADAPELTGEGFLSDLVAFLPAETGIVVAPAPSPAPTAAESALTTERTLWKQTLAANTREAYLNYLDRYPNGLFVVIAQDAVEALNSDTRSLAQIDEDRLSLSRDQRRQIQRNLALMDTDPKGIDGVFGPGSRNAISAWQGRNGHEATGYLTVAQITQLQAQADRRAAELEAEAAKRQAEQEASDRIYWGETGNRGDEPGLRAYLKRYPDGLYAELAQQRLDAITVAKGGSAASAERAAWDAAIKGNTIASVQEYLQRYPKGAFVEEANQFIADRQQANAQNAAYQKTEEALGLTPQMRNVVEGRLAALGLKPGPVDGTFTPETRRALRRYQEARKLPPTGYLSQQVMVRLLVDSL
jgi:peptidoglycan hydrolase-like protein with peptidoglycan-binding domain